MALISKVFMYIFQTSDKFYVKSFNYFPLSITGIFPLKINCYNTMQIKCMYPLFSQVSAIKWQTSIGCEVAGFFGVLSSELSVFTLSVITLERNYAITHAMHLNKRLSLRHAGYIMFVGWSFASAMAAMPLVGISDYKKFAICLPFETEDVLSLTYVVFLILINGVAFLILMGCYLKMYCAIRGSQAWNSNDSRIARRMALLVFTDFICWAPIAFFSLSAVSGLQLISLEVTLKLSLIAIL